MEGEIGGRSWRAKLGGKCLNVGVLRARREFSPPREESISDSKVVDLEKDFLRLQLEMVRLREENKKLCEVNRMNTEALKENCKLFQKLKPQRPFLSTDRKLYIAGLQLFKCAAPHGKDKCPMHLLNAGSFNEAGFEVDHSTPFCVGYRNVGELSAICHACHALKSRLERIKAAEDTGADVEEESAPNE